MKQAIQQEVRRARGRQEKETSAAASGVVGKVLARERNEGYSKQPSQQDVSKRKKEAIPLGVCRVRCRQEQEMSDSVNGGVGVSQL
jgi:hypothetical protein